MLVGFALSPREGQGESTGEKVTIPWHSGTAPRPCGPARSFWISVRAAVGALWVSGGPLDHAAGRFREQSPRTG